MREKNRHFANLLIMLSMTWSFSNANALEVLESRFALHVSKSDFYHKWSQQKFQVSRAIDYKKSHMSFQQEGVPLQLKNFQARGEAKMRFSESRLARHQLVSSLELNLKELSFSDLVLDHKVERNIGGNRLVVDLKASCKDLKLEFPEEIYALVYAQIDTQSKQKLRIGQVGIQFYHLPESPQVSVGSCIGVEGARSYLQDQILNELKSPKSLERLLTPILQAEVNRQVEEINQSLFRWMSLVDQENFHILVFPENLEYVEDGGFQVNGKLLFYIGKPTDSQYRYQNLGHQILSQEIENTEYSALYLPEKILEDLWEPLFRNQAFLWNSETDKIPALKSLMASRFKQYYVWRDFRNFPEKSNFRFTHTQRDRGELKSLQVSPEKLSGEVYHQGGFDILAPKEGQYIDYAKLDINLRIHFEIKPQESKIQVLPHVVEQSSSHSYSPSYLQKYSVKDRVSHSRIQKELKKMIEKEPRYFDNPVLKIWPGAKDLLWKSLIPKEKSLVLKLS